MSSDLRSDASSNLEVPDKNGSLEVEAGWRTVEEQFRLTLEEAPTGMVVIDRRGKIAIVNAQLEQLFGYSRSDLIGQPMETLIAEASRSPHAVFQKGFVATGSARRRNRTLELVGRRKDGTEIAIELVLHRLRTESGDLVLGSIVDLTALRTADSERDILSHQLRMLREDLARRVRKNTTQLAVTLKDRDVLLREIRQRMKNNLQIMVSMIDLQIRRRGHATGAELRAFRARVQDMARIQEGLWRDEDQSPTRPSIPSNGPAHLATAPGRSPADFSLDGESPPLPLQAPAVSDNGATVENEALLLRDEAPAFPDQARHLRDEAYSRPGSAANQLRAREHWFSTTLRSVADAVISVDLAGEINFMNPTAEALTGCSAAEAVGRKAGDVLRLIDDQARAFDETPLETALREARPVTIEQAALVNVASGAIRIIADSAAPVVDGQRTLGAVMVFRDITQSRTLDKRLEAADRLASLGTMAAGVGHEIRNPLAVFVANVELLGKELGQLRADIQESPVEAQNLQQRVRQMMEILSDLESASQRIDRIVSDLGNLARPRVGGNGPIDVRRPIEWAIRSTASELRHRAEVRTDLREVAPVKADDVRLGQVLVNLLVNAAHAIPPGRASENDVTISVDTDESGRVVIEVRDTGAGIPAEVLARIFEPFFTTSMDGVGTGLGLSICQDIVRSFGGELQAESELGRGSRFRIILLPADKDTAPQVD